jgi:hypothetical protein
MRTLLRIAALCIVTFLSVLLFYFGREHQIFIDNRTIEIEGRSYRAPQLVRVTINDGASIELMPRQRDLAKIIGPSFRFKVEVMDGAGEQVEKLIERELTPGFSKDIMLSIPLLAHDRDDFVLPPPTVQAPPPEKETPVEDDLIPPENGIM